MNAGAAKIVSREGRCIYVSVQGFGDALVSLQLLQRAGGLPMPLTILGSANTTAIQGVLGTSFDIRPILPGHAQFYKLRTAAPRSILSDVRRFRSWVSANTRACDTILFEKRDWRNQILASPTRARVVAPRPTGSAYLDRKRMIEEISGRVIELPLCVRPQRAPTSVLINPSAGAPNREIPRDIVESLIELFRRRRCRIGMIDPAGRLAGIKVKFDDYRGAISLADAGTVLRSYDLYLGPDSLFIHLAYYFRMPFFTLLPRRMFPFEFAPPGSRPLGNYAGFDDAVDAAVLERRLGAFVGW